MYAVKGEMMLCVREVGCWGVLYTEETVMLDKFQIILSSMNEQRIKLSGTRLDQIKLFSLLNINSS